MVELPDGEKNLMDTYNRLDRIPACDRRMDGQTDILPRHSPSYAYASRGKSESHMPDYGHGTPYGITPLIPPLKNP